MAAILGVVWSEEKDDIKDLIYHSERMMREWVRGEINDLKLEGLEDQLHALRINLDAFQKTKDPSSQRIKLLNCLSDFVKAMTTFIKKDPRELSETELIELRKKHVQGSVAIAVEIASLHIALLRERVVFRDDMAFPAVDHALGEQALTDTIDLYQSYFETVAVPAENEWRDKMLETTDFHGTLGGNTYTIEDRVTRQAHRFADVKKGNQRNTQHSYINRDYYLEQAKQSYATSLLANVSDTVALFSLLDPAYAGLPPIDQQRTTWVGPATGLVNKDGNQHDARRDLLLDAEGEITQIDIQSGDAVDHIKVTFKDGSSAQTGNPQGGTAKSFSLPEGVYITAVETWWDWELTGIQFHMSDGSKSDVMGKARVHRQYSELPHHRVTGFRFEGKPDDRTGKRVGNAMSVAFQLEPGFYDA
jgi:hypothetical protein